MPTYIATYEPGPSWLPGKPLGAQPLRPHLDYLLGLHERGSLLMGGPLADGTGGLVILNADSIEEAEGLISRDPAVAEGILVAQISEWARIV